jgi:hypothetical protein
MLCPVHYTVARKTCPQHLASFRGMLYGTVMISANFFYDVIFLLKRILNIVKNKTVRSSRGCVVELFRARVDSSNPMQVLFFFVFD